MWVFFLACFIDLLWLRYLACYKRGGVGWGGGKLRHDLSGCLCLRREREKESGRGLGGLELGNWEGTY